MLDIHAIQGIMTIYKLKKEKELAMQALIINFNLHEITRSDYEGV